MLSGYDNLDTFINKLKHNIKNRRDTNSIYNKLGQKHSAHAFYQKTNGPAGFLV